MFRNADLSAGQRGLEGIMVDFTPVKSTMIPSKNPIFYVSLATSKMLENLNYSVLTKYSHFMKLRTTHNSIRIRIRKSEIVTLQKNASVQESIQFPNGTSLFFTLMVSLELETVTATFENNKLVVAIPKDKANQWMTSNEVGIETNIPLANEEQLHVLIEKDFPCLDRTDEDKSDTFWELVPDKPASC